MKVIGKVTDIQRIRTFQSGTRFATIGDTVEIELPKGMKLIGKRKDCRWYEYGTNSYTMCLNSPYDDGSKRVSVHNGFCPCWRWKERK